MSDRHAIESALEGNKTMADAIFEQLKRDIIVGKLEPGERLVERELTQRFHVSRTPMREALKYLVRSGLAVEIPYRGVEVRRLDYEFTRDLYDLRLGIEGLAAYLAAERAAAEDHDAIREAFNRIGAAAKKANRDEVMVLNGELHMAIARATGNRLLVQQVDELWTSINLVRGTAWRGNLRTDPSRQEHEEIVTAILARDAVAARSAMESHIRRSWTIVEEALLQSEGDTAERDPAVQESR